MKKTIRKALMILFWIVMWAVLAHVVDNKILLSTPIRTAKELFALLGDKSFYRTIAMSLLRIGTGFFAGMGTAVLLAAVSCRFPFLEDCLSPLISLLKAIPVASFVVLLLIWWGSSFLAAVVSFLVVLPGIYINTLEGLKNVDRELLEMGKVFRLSPGSCFFYIYRPALQPYLYSSMKTALGMSWKSGVAAEVIGMADLSIGGQIYMSKIYLDTAGVFAWTAVVIMLSFLFEKLVIWLTDRFFDWQPACRKPEVKSRGQQVKPKKGEQRRRFPREANAGDAVASDDRGFVLENVCKRYHDITVFKDRNDFFEQGHVYYLREPSGSGKTTLLRLLAGLEQPDSGRVKTIASCSMVFQEDRLCRGYSAVKNVEMVTGDATAARAELEKLLEPEALDKPCEVLSGGMKRRVALVRAMEADSDCVLLDEPFTGMDAETRACAEEYVRTRRNGRTLIIAKHI